MLYIKGLKPIFSFTVMNLSIKLKMCKFSMQQISFFFQQKVLENHVLLLTDSVSFKG